MTNEKWEELNELTKKHFKGVESYTEDLVLEDGHVASQDILIFTTPQGKYKLIRENKPVVLEKKMHYSHRPGDTARTEYKLSDTELSHKLHVFKELDFDEWEEVTLTDLGL